METFNDFISLLSGLLWGKVLWLVILGVGLSLSIRLGFIQFTKLATAFKLLWQGRKATGVSGISPFGALMVSMSATVGTGNIVGVATAIGIGGPGALFWMWCSAVFGMATKYAEAVCAVKFREKNRHDHYVGGPMYYIKNGLGRRWMWLAVLFAVFGSLAGFGIGNTVQAHSVSEALQGAFGANKYVLAVILSLLTALVLLGGIKSIAVAAKGLVPVMSVLYVLGGLVVILFNLGELPAAFKTIVQDAFTGTAAQGGFAGAAVALAIQKGIARGVFSNEAGLGSAPIAHAAAETNSPVKQGCIAMLGTFIDTIVICSITGLAIVVTGVWTGEVQGAAMSQAAFQSVIPMGAKFVAISLALFAFSTILGWSYYGERCAEFLFGTGAKVPYRVLWVLMIPLGVVLSLEVVWAVADVLNGLMAFPNLIALIALSGVVVKLTREHFGSTEEKKEIGDA